MIYSNTAESKSWGGIQKPETGTEKADSLSVLRFTQQNNCNPRKSVSAKIWPTRQLNFEYLRI